MIVPSFRGCYLSLLLFFIIIIYYCSGGPLLDSKGNLIGINTAIFTQTGNFFIHTSQNLK